MSTFTNNRVKKDDTGFYAFFALVVAFLMISISGLSYAGEQPIGHKMDHSKDYLLYMDPTSSEIIGPALTKQVSDFFDYADNAIKTKNIDALAGLYSDNYLDGTRKKSDVMLVWKRLFNDFDNITLTHNMRFITSEANNKMVILQCNGFLMGIPKGEKYLRALDSWMNMNHVLVKEGEKWKIIGTQGQEQKRFWFDKPLHPLF